MKKKGFTLIELLAVIIILAVIALIATPLILDVVSDAEEESRIQTVNGYIEATRMYISEAMIKDLSLEGNLFDTIKDRVKGTKPETGEIFVGEENKIAVALKVDGYCYIKQFDDVQAQRSNNEECSLGTTSNEVTYEVNAPTYEINQAKCEEYFTNFLSNETERAGFCDGTLAVEGLSLPFILKNAFTQFDVNDMRAKGVISDTRTSQKLTCIVKEKIVESYEVDETKCKEWIIKMNMGEEAGNVYCAPSQDNELGNMRTLFDVSYSFVESAIKYGAIKNVLYSDDYIITGYRCHEGNDFGLPVSLDVTIASDIAKIGILAFGNKNINSIDFSGATSLKKIEQFAFNVNNIQTLDLSGATNLETIGTNAFSQGKLTTIKIPNNVQTIEVNAFGSSEANAVITVDNYEDAIAGKPWGAVNATVNWLPCDGTVKTELTSYKINEDKCQVEFEQQAAGAVSSEEIAEFCAGTGKIMGVFTFDTYLQEAKLEQSFADKGIIYDLVYETKCKGCFETSNIVISYDLDEAVCRSVLGSGMSDFTAEEVDIICTGGVTEKGNSADEFAYNSTEGSIKLGLIKNVVYDDTKVEITKFLCNGTDGFPNIDDVVIPNTIDGTAVTKIGYSSFYSARLNSIDFSQAKNLDEIKDYAFQYGFASDVSTSLDLSGATSLIKIGKGAFDNNNKLISAIIPNNVVSIADNAFTNTPNLKTITIDKVSGSIENAPWGANSATVNWLR